MTFHLRDYQLDLIQSIQQSMSAKNKRILTQSPAGSGKSVTMAEIARLATDKKNFVLFVVHRRELVDQIKSTFKANGVDFNHCYVGMVQTVTNKLDKLSFKPSIILVDEAHHSLAKTYQRIFDHFPDAYTLGFTATPTLLSGKGLGRFYDDLIIGKSVQWLIDNHRLAPFDYYSIDLLNHDQLKHSSTGDYTYKSIDDATKNVQYGDVIEHYKKLADNTKTIIYTHSVEASKRVAEAFKSAGYSAQAVDGKTNKQVRQQAMEDFRSGKVTILVNAELYGEGVDVPDCETVVLLRPTESLSLFIQQTMRSMRYQPNKQATIIDHVGNYLTHGLPNTEHVWTLEDVEKNKKSKDRPEDLISLTSCPHCFAVIESGSNPCPLCNFEIVVEAKDLEVVDADLNKIDQVSFQTDYRAIRLKKEYAQKEVSELNTIEDFYLYAKSRGYKDSWIKFQHYSLSKLSFPEFYMKLKPLKKKYAEIFN